MPSHRMAVYCSNCDEDVVRHKTLDSEGNITGYECPKGHELDGP